MSRMGPVEAKRVILDAVSIPAKTTTAYDNPKRIDLLVCQENVNEETVSNGTTVAEAKMYSKLIGMKLNLVVHGIANNDTVRWMLIKDADGDQTITSLADSPFHDSDDNPTARERRSLILSKGMLIGTDRSGARLPVFIKRKTLHRLGGLRENDKLTLVLAMKASVAASISGFGTLYVRMN